MKSLALLGLCLFGLSAYAQDVKVVTPDLFCKIDGFSLHKGKSAAVRGCDALKSERAPTTSLEDCKKRAQEKGAECMAKVKGKETFAVKGSFYEKFSVSEKSTSFTCVIEPGGVTSCP